MRLGRLITAASITPPLRASKKLGRQNKLAGLLFQLCEIGIWVMAEAGAQDAGMAFLAETASEFVPSRAVDAAQIGTARWLLAGGHGGDQARLAAQHDRRRGGLAPRRAPLVVALRAELMLKIVVGARQVRNAVAVEQARAIAAGDLAEVLDRAAQAGGAVAMAEHGTHQSIEVTLQRGCILGVMVVQDVRRLVHPWIDALDVRPEGTGLCQALPDQLLQLRKRRRGAPCILPLPMPTKSASLSVDGSPQPPRVREPVKNKVPRPPVPSGTRTVAR